MELTSFDDIRSFNDDELRAAFQRITKQKEFCAVMRYIFPEQPLEHVLQRFLDLNNIDYFQQTIIYPYLQSIEHLYTKGIISSNISAIEQEQNCLFISNHRDIILDSALLCKCLMEAGKNTVEIAIGDNLLIYPWIRDFVRANKSFIVKRDGAMRERLQNSQHLSAYIEYVLHTKHSSIWIAQREGRTKDSNDRTQESVLKMLTMSGTGTFLENIAHLNICPVAISYEYDPCDYLKAKEFQQKRDNADYHKLPQDDLTSMRIGVTGQKGHVTFRFTPSINSELAEIAALSVTRNAEIALVAQLIDKHIHSNYEIYPNNRIAFDLLTNSKQFESQYSTSEKADFEQYISTQIAKIDLTEKDEPFLRQKMLEIYANPLINQLKVKN